MKKALLNLPKVASIALVALILPMAVWAQPAQPQTQSPGKAKIRPIQLLSNEVLQEIYGENQAALNKLCAKPAEALCKRAEANQDAGETDSATNVIFSEYQCLHKLVYRLTRQRIRELDGTACDKAIRNAQNEYFHHLKRFSKSKTEIYNLEGDLIKNACKDNKRVDVSTLSGFASAWKLSTRYTKQGVPGYDGTDCDKQIRKLASKYSYSSTRTEIPGAPNHKVEGSTGGGGNSAPVKASDEAQQ